MEDENQNPTSIRLGPLKQPLKDYAKKKGQSLHELIKGILIKFYVKNVRKRKK